MEFAYFVLLIALCFVLFDVVGLISAALGYLKARLTGERKSAQESLATSTEIEELRQRIAGLESDVECIKRTAVDRSGGGD